LDKQDLSEATLKKIASFHESYRLVLSAFDFPEIVTNFLFEKGFVSPHDIEEIRSVLTPYVERTHLNEYGSCVSVIKSGDGGAFVLEYTSFCRMIVLTYFFVLIKIENKGLGDIIAGEIIRQISGPNCEDNIMKFVDRISPTKDVAVVALGLDKDVELDSEVMDQLRIEVVKEQLDEEDNQIEVSSEMVVYEDNCQQEQASYDTELKNVVLEIVTEHDEELRKALCSVNKAMRRKVIWRGLYAYNRKIKEYKKALRYYYYKIDTNDFVSSMEAISCKTARVVDALGLDKGAVNLLYDEYSKGAARFFKQDQFGKKYIYCACKIPPPKLRRVMVAQILKKISEYYESRKVNLDEINVVCADSPLLEIVLPRRRRRQPVLLYRHVEHLKCIEGVKVVKRTSVLKGYKEILEYNPDPTFGHDVISLEDDKGNRECYIEKDRELRMPEIFLSLNEYTYWRMRTCGRFKV